MLSQDMREFHTHVSKDRIALESQSLGKTSRSIERHTENSRTSTLSICIRLALGGQCLQGEPDAFNEI